MRSSALAVLIVCALGGVGRADPMLIVVNTDNPVGEVSREFVREVFLKKTTQWPRGEAIRPIDLSRKIAVRDRFVRDVIRKTPAQLKSYWSQQIFSGKGVPPPEADSASAVIAYVQSHKGAIAYLPADADARGVKVLKVK